MVLHDAATSSHSLVVALSRRLDVVIIGFRSCSSGLPTRLLGALESDSFGHADSAFRYSPNPADRIEQVSESSSVDDSRRGATFAFLGEGEEEEDREAEGGGTRTRTEPPPEDTTVLELAAGRFSLEFFLLRASGEVTTPTSLEAALEASESLWVTPGLLLLGEEEEASPKLRATLGSWATTDPADCAEAAAAAAAAVPA